MSATFRQVVREAFLATVKKVEKIDEYPSVLAGELREILRREGYSIHRSGECVHPRGPKPSEIGRPMTPEEAAVLLPRAEEVHDDAPIE